MSKYSTQFKLTVVKYCTEEHYGYRQAANHFNIPSKVTVQQWVRKYKEHGISGLTKNPKTTYSGDFKINVIKYMHDNHLSCFETAIHFNLSGSERVEKWLRIYCEKGPQALYKKKCGHDKKNMSFKPKNKKLSEDNEKNLLKELEYLRAENAYLKKLDALVQERIKRENKKKQ